MVTLLLTLQAGGFWAGAAPPARGPEARALAYLAREVPRWRAKNGCYSCHNNGDAARALATAVRAGRTVPAAALADTTAWLRRPDDWDRQEAEAAFRDRKLARLQFAAALAAGQTAGLARDRRALDRAARLVADAQDPDGSWRVLAKDTLGSPVTYGTPLATYLARETLRRADARGHAKAIARADRWLRKAPVDAVLDAAAVCLALGKADDPAALAQRRRCLELLRKGESRRGGWGPYVNAAPEVFDTAVVVLALAAAARTAEGKAWLRRGRAYLVRAQQKDGSWPETTRPSGSASYAQRLSTTAWATLALLATSPGTAP
jgi:hypothetical protein